MLWHWYYFLIKFRKWPLKKRLEKTGKRERRRKKREEMQKSGERMREKVMDRGKRAPVCFKEF